jgi:hypothetical protein
MDWQICSRAVALLFLANGVAVGTSSAQPAAAQATVLLGDDAPLSR